MVRARARIIIVIRHGVNTVVRIAGFLVCRTVAAKLIYIYVYGKLAVLEQQCFGNRCARRVNQHLFAQQDFIVKLCFFSTLVAAAEIFRQTISAEAEVIVARFRIRGGRRTDKLDRHTDIALVIRKINSAVFKRDRLPRTVVCLNIDIAVVARISFGGIGHGAVVVIIDRAIEVYDALPPQVVPIVFLVPLALRFQFKGKTFDRDLGEVEPEPDFLGILRDPVLA